MHRSSKDNEQSDLEAQTAADQVEEQLQKSLQGIDNEAEADAVIQEIAEDRAGESSGEAVAKAPRPTDAPTPAKVKEAQAKIDEAVRDQPDEVSEAAAAIETTAVEAATLEENDAAAAATIERAISKPFWRKEPERYERPRRLLLDAFLRHRSIPVLQRLDAEAFLWINAEFPHPPALNAFFRAIALLFRNGWGWQIGMLLCVPWRPRRVWQLMQWAVPSIYLTALVVERPVKWYFQRRRPFLRIVRSVLIGAEPSSWSFPSGHAAAAAAGAHALTKLVPQRRPLWYLVAGLVGFCRAYLGAHYPSDIIAGGFCGVVLTELTFWLLRRLGLKRP